MIPMALVAKDQQTKLSAISPKIIGMTPLTGPILSADTKNSAERAINCCGLNYSFLYNFTTHQTQGK
jgi:hypothetical protein